MDKELVIVVRNENAAYEVVRSLRALDDQGAIELYASTVVTKAPDGTISVKDKHDVRGPWVAAAGITTGALLGLLAGPVGAAAGVAIGGAVGGVAAIGADLAYSGITGEFVHAAAMQLQPGTSAVLASVFEDWTIPIDVAMAPLGAMVFRQATDNVVAAQIKADWQAAKDELARVDYELQKAVGDEKVKLEAKREELRKKVAADRKQLELRARRLEESWDAKIASIEAKAAASKAKAEARHREHAQRLSTFAATEKKAFHDLFA